MEEILLKCEKGEMSVREILHLASLESVANLIKHITIVNYDARVVLTTILPILQP